MSQPYLSTVFEDVSEEGDKARAKFGEQRHLTDLEWFAILSEEVGEVAMLVTKGYVRPVTDVIVPAALRAEIVQVAAVALRWLDTFDENHDPNRLWDNRRIRQMALAGVLSPDDQPRRAASERHRPR